MTERTPNHARYSLGNLREGCWVRGHKNPDSDRSMTMVLLVPGGTKLRARDPYKSYYGMMCVHYDSPEEARKAARELSRSLVEDCNHDAILDWYNAA